MSDPTRHRHLRALPVLMGAVFIPAYVLLANMPGALADDARTLLADGPPSWAPEASSDDAAALLQLAALMPPGTGRLVGRMVDLDGRPVSDVTLWLADGGAGTAALPVRGDAAGRFALSAIPTGEINLHSFSGVRHAVYGVRVAPHGPTRVNLIVDRGPYSLAGRVVDRTGAAIPGAKVSLLWTAERDGLLSRSARAVATDADGRFQFANLGPGSHLVVASAPGRARTSIARRVGPAAGPVTVVLPPRAD